MKWLMFFLAFGVEVGTALFGAEVVLRSDGTANGGVGTAFSVASPHFTAEAWFRPVRMEGENVILSQFGPGLPGRSSLQVHNGKIAFYNSDGNDWTEGATEIESGTWHHVAYVQWSGEYSLIYLDGRLEVSNATPPIALSPTTCVIGNLFAEPNEIRPSFEGDLAEIRVWYRTLPEEVIRENMNRRLDGNEEGLQAYWPLSRFRDGSTLEVVSGIWQDFGPHFSAVTDYSLEFTPSSFAYVPTYRASTLNGYYLRQAGIPIERPATLGQVFTIETWIFPTTEDESEQWILSQFAPGVGRLNLRLQNGHLIFWQGDCDPESVETDETLPLNRWTHIACAHDASSLRIYLNGRCVKAVPVAVSSDPPATPICIGGKNGERLCANAWLQEFRIWSKALDEEQVQANMYKALSGSEEGLEALFPFSECFGESVLDLVSGKTYALPSGAMGWTGVPHLRVEQTVVASGDNLVAFFPNCENSYTNNVQKHAFVQTERRITTAAFTIEAWINPEPYSVTGFAPENTILAQFETDAPGRMCLFLKYGSLHFFQDGLDENVDGQTQIRPRAWTHVAFTQDGTRQALYVNGRLDAEAAYAASGAPCPDATIQIGAINRNNYNFFGRMADVRVWNYARSAEDVMDYKDHRLKGTERGLVGYWPLDGGPLDGVATRVSFENTAFALKPPRTLRTILLVR